MHSPNKQLDAKKPKSKRSQLLVFFNPAMLIKRVSDWQCSVVQFRSTLSDYKVVTQWCFVLTAKKKPCSVMRRRRFGSKRVKAREQRGEGRLNFNPGFWGGRVI